MRVIMTGQVGVEKKPYLDGVAQLAADHAEPISFYHVGDRMYEEAPDVRPGAILDLPLGRLHTLRRSVFKDIIADSADQANIVVNTHATFRWRHGLFRAFDFDQVKKLRPDLFVCLVDNAESTYYRLHREHSVDATLKDVMVWREEEIMATELLAQAMGCGNRFFVLSRGRAEPTTAAMLSLVTQPDRRKVYPSFPMSHVVDMPDVLDQICQFRATLAEHFVTFDPADVDEKIMLDKAIAAAKEGKDFIEGSALDSQGQLQTFNVSVKQILDCAGDIDGQIYARDFKLIDQSDMIVSYIPELPGGIPGLSSGVERELQHAFEGAKQVYVVWMPQKNPSPFITETATRVFRSTSEALEHFESEGMFNSDGLFG